MIPVKIDQFNKRTIFPSKKRKKKKRKILLIISSALRLTYRSLSRGHIFSIK